MVQTRKFKEIDETWARNPKKITIYFTWNQQMQFVYDTFQFVCSTWLFFTWS